MYSLYLCVHCFSVYGYVYSCACSFCVHVTLRRGALLFLATLEPFFDQKSSSLFAVRFALHAFAAVLCIPLPFAVSFMPFAVPFALKRLQRSFHAVLSRFKRSKFWACTFAPFALFRALI